MPRARRTLRRSLNLLLGVSAVVLVVASVLFGISLKTAADLRDEAVENIHLARLATRDLRTAMVDQETGIRGYAISGDESFLDPYRRGQADSNATIETLRPLVAQNETISASLEAVERSRDAWEQTAAEPAISAIDQGIAIVSDQAFQEQSKLSFEAVRDSIDALDADLTAQRATTLDQLAQAERFVVLAGIATVATAVIAGAAIYRSLRRSVLAPLDRLGADVRTVVEGEFARHIQPSGPPELLALGTDVELMRERIVAEFAVIIEARDNLTTQADELARSNLDLEQFAYVASHDLQEPLRKIAGFCQLLQRRYEGQLDERADEYIFYVVDGAKRMQDLINDLLAFSRVGRTTDRFVRVDLGRTVDAALRDLEVRLEDADATIKRDDMSFVLGDPRLLTTLFVNLIGNAVKFRGDDPPVVTVTHVDDGTMCEVTVSDNGIGIEPEYADQVFVLFKRLHTRSEFDGTGIGLALCKRIVEFHDGRIWLADHEGGGTSVRFTLPLAADDAYQGTSIYSSGALEQRTP